MIVKDVVFEDVDYDTGFVLKKIITSDGSFLGRQMPVMNSLFYCERIRKSFNLSILDSRIQTHNIHFGKKIKCWMFDKNFLEAKQHAKEESRLFFPFLQRTKVQLALLDWNIAESDFIEMLNTGVEYVSYVIPESATLNECEKWLFEASTQLRGNQKIFPVLSANHNVYFFKSILESFFGKYFFIGIHYASPNSNINSRVNMIDLWHLNSQMRNGKTSIIVGFNVKKHYGSSHVSGSFASGRFGIDIPSQEQMHPENIKGMMASKEEESELDSDYIYDEIEGGFNKAEEQIVWYNGVNRTLKLLQNITLSERLTKPQAIMWSNFIGQQNDFYRLNTSIIDKNKVRPLISEKSRWLSYYNSTIQ